MRQRFDLLYCGSRRMVRDERSVVWGFNAIF